MPHHWLHDHLRNYGDFVAIDGPSGPHTYAELIDSIESLTRQLKSEGLGRGSIVCFTADFSPTAYAALFAITDIGGIVVPIAPDEDRLESFISITSATHSLDRSGHLTKLEQRDEPAPLLKRLISEGYSGIILFTSGSTGEPKAALHNFDKFTEKYRKPSRPRIAVAVSPMDHISGLDTLFYGLASGGTVITTLTQAPDDVLAAVEQYEVEILPVTPSFLRLMLISNATSRRDLSSLKLVAYGAEVMPPELLKTVSNVLPNAKFIQKFGMTEIGSPVTRSAKDGTTWVRLDPESVEHKIVDGILWLRSESAMLGYLNSPSPIDSDGWLNTGDEVEQSGDHIRILGRLHDMINIGGHKVNPYEVENVLLTAPGITSAWVRGESNPLLGQIPVAYVETSETESDSQLSQRVRKWCSERLSRWQVPAKVVRGAPELIPGRNKVDRTNSQT